MGFAAIRTHRRRTHFETEDYDFGVPDRFVTGTVGQPGHRTFFLQARKGSALVSVVIEKIQVLAERLALLLRACLLYTSPSPRDGLLSRMPSSA